MQTACKPDPCCCPPVLVPICPPPCPPTPKPHDPCSKYYRQIGAEAIGNHLIISMEKDKSKSKRRLDQWDPPCDCDVVEIQRPSKKEGPKILKCGNDDRILFRVRSKGHVSKDDYKPQAISYKMGSCKGIDDQNNECKTITFHPQWGVPGCQEVHTDEIIQGDEKICLLKIKKKPADNQKFKRNVELELRTPKPPTPPTSPSMVSLKSPIETVCKRSLDKVPLKKQTKKKKKKKKKKK